MLPLLRRVPDLYLFIGKIQPYLRLDFNDIKTLFYACH
jgi:hypothetical protein